jgi:hypothetical protein
MFWIGFAAGFASCFAVSLIGLFAIWWLIFSGDQDDD